MAAVSDEVMFVSPVPDRHYKKERVLMVGRLGMRGGGSVDGVRLAEVKMFLTLKETAYRFMNTH